MDSKTIEMMYKIELRVTQIENSLTNRFEKLDKLKSVCAERLGFKEHVIWHMCFNADKLKDLHEIFVHENVSALRVFDKRTENEFERISNILELDKQELYLAYNEYLIKKEQGLI